MKMMKKRRRLWAAILAILMLANAVNLTAIADVGLAQKTDGEGVIVSFEPLRDSVKKQTVIPGTAMEELELPDKIKATVKWEKDDENVASASDMDSSATRSDASSVRGSGSGSSRKKMDVQVYWEAEPVYEAEQEGTYVFTAQPEDYDVKDGVECPQIIVTVNGDVDLCTKTSGCTLAEGHEGNCTAKQALGITRNGELSGTGYTFDPDSGKLIMSSDAGTVNWQKDGRFAPEDVLEAELAAQVRRIEAGAFSGCTNMDWLIARPYNAPRLANDAFKDSPNLYILVPYVCSGYNYNSWISYKDRLVAGSALTDLTIAGGTLTKPFSPADSNITITVPYQAEEFIMTPTTYGDAAIEVVSLKVPYSFASGETKAIKIDKWATRTATIYIDLVNRGNADASMRKQINLFIEHEEKPALKPITQGYDITFPEPKTGEKATGGIFIETEQYKIQALWNPAPHLGQFEPNKAYTVTLELVPKQGYTVQGVQPGLFTVNGEKMEFQSKTTNPAWGTMSIDYPKTEKELVTSSIWIEVPARGATFERPVKNAIPYTAEVSWEPRLEKGDPFAAGTEYTAFIKMTPTENYTLEGLGEDYFEVAYAASTSYAPASQVITARFPKTMEAVSIRDIPGVTLPVTGKKPTSVIDATSQYRGTVDWTPSIPINGTFSPDTEYTATINLTPLKGYDFEGIPENYFRVEGAVQVENEAEGRIVTAKFPKTDATVSIQTITGVTVPAHGEQAALAIDETEEYTGTVSWSPALTADGRFEENTEYTATITLTAKDGYTLFGVAKDYFRVSGAEQVGNAPNQGIITARFSKTLEAVSIRDIQGVTPPVAGEKPVRVIGETSQYRGTVEWIPQIPSDGTFSPGTEYTAAIELTPLGGYDFKGVPADYFRVEGAVQVENEAEGHIVTAKFPKTDSTVSIQTLAGVTVPAYGEQAALAIDDTEEYTGTVSWSPALAADGRFEEDTEYTATITLKVKDGYTLLGVMKDSFRVPGADQVGNAADSGVITVRFPKTGIAPVYSIIVEHDGNGTAIADKDHAAEGETITLTADANRGYHFKEWQVLAGNVTIADNRFVMPAGAVRVKAVFERDRRGSDNDSSSSSTTDTSVLNGNWERTDDGIWKFRQTNRSYAANRWGLINGLWYYFNSDGRMMTGWNFIDNHWYYLCTEEYVKAHPGMKEGAMLTGWYYDAAYQKWFYFNDSGAMVVGWREIDGKKYYFNPVSDGTKGAMITDSH